MLEINIPNYKNLQLQHLVLDYNGTIAVNGLLVEGVRERMNRLTEHLNIHVLTADILMPGILPALDILLNPTALIATLRS